MDKYLTIFTEQLDKEFKPETLFPDKGFYTMEWLKREFIIRKNRKKQAKKNSTLNITAEVEYVSLTASLP